MQSFTVHTGIVAALQRDNIDTDQIIPKQFLKRVERTGYGDVLFLTGALIRKASLMLRFH
jgi:3-isopropylmalate/(R)-2-methylmalate dehydratase small subunit